MTGWRDLWRGVVLWHEARERRQTLKLALRTAYGQFAQEEPRWACSLFDEHFVLTHLYARLLTVENVYDVEPQLIATAWTAQLDPDSSQTDYCPAILEGASARFLELVKDIYPKPTLPESHHSPAYFRHSARRANA